jgi:hypothetical protein
MGYLFLFSLTRCRFSKFIVVQAHPERRGCDLRFWFGRLGSSLEVGKYLVRINMEEYAKINKRMTKKTSSREFLAEYRFCDKSLLSCLNSTGAISFEIFCFKSRIICKPPPADEKF